MKYFLQKINRIEIWFFDFWLDFDAISVIPAGLAGTKYALMMPPTSSTHSP